MVHGVVRSPRYEDTTDSTLVRLNPLNEVVPTYREEGKRCSVIGQEVVST